MDEMNGSEATAWQIRATLSSRGWESCTRECYEDTLRTGRYMGLRSGTKNVEVRELFAASSNGGVTATDFASAMRNCGLSLATYAKVDREARRLAKERAAAEIAKGVAKS